MGLGNQTVLSGFVSKGKDSSRNLQMISRALMTPDELNSMSKGSFITKRKWLRTFDSIYTVEHLPC